MNPLNKLNTDQPPVKVESEWAELKECVYGSPDHWVLPLIYNDSRLRAQGEFGKFWLKNAGRDMKEASPELFNELSTQIKGAINFLETSGVRVHVAGTISPENRKFPRGEDHGVSTPWMRDPFVTIGTNVIELAPRSLFHRRQRFAIREILASTMDRGARYFAQPDGGADEETNGAGWGYLEGGDIFVIGKNILVGGTTLFIKNPDKKGFVSFHQDAKYIGLEPHNWVTAWIAITDSNEENGCMRMLSGSHKKELQEHYQKFDEDNLLTRGQTIENVPLDKTTPIVLKAGQMSLHHPTIVHGSGINRSNDRRIGFVVQSYIGSDVDQVLGKIYVQQARGNDIYKFHEHTVRPKKLMDAKHVQIRKKANEELSKIFYKNSTKKGKY